MTSLPPMVSSILSMMSFNISIRTNQIYSYRLKFLYLNIEYCEIYLVCSPPFIEMTSSWRPFGPFILRALRHPRTHRHSAPGHSAFGHSAPGHPAPRTLRSQDTQVFRTYSSLDIQLPGHSGLSDIQVFRTYSSLDKQLPGHSGLSDIQVFRTTLNCWQHISNTNI